MLEIRSRIVTAAILGAVVLAFLLVFWPDIFHSKYNFRITRTFLIVFAISWVVGGTRLIARLEGLVFRLARQGGMVFDYGDSSEIVRVNLIRIVVGLLFFVRAAWIGEDVFRADLISGAFSADAMATLFMLISSACITVGVLTPIFCLFMTVLMYWHLEGSLLTQTLGTYVLLMIMMTFTFLPAGTALSIDAYLARRYRFWNRTLAVAYAPFGRPSAQRSAVVRFMSFMSYGLLCLYSSLYHIDDDAWIEGFANLQALTSPFLSRHYDFFQHYYDSAPALAIWSSKITGIGMICWELFLIPLVLLSRWTRFIAILWGLMFFVFSLTLFQLSFLPYYEFAFWALMFMPMVRAMDNAPAQIDIFFDDRCNLCDRTMRFLLRVDVFSIILPRPASQNIPLMSEKGLSYDQAMTDLFGWDPIAKRLYGGFDFYLLITRRLILLMPLYLLLIIADGLRLGRPAYRWIAERRRTLFGVCQFSLVPDVSAIDSGTFNFPENRWSLFRGVVVSHIILSLAFLTLMPYSPINRAVLPKKIAKVTDGIAQAALNYGIGEINVFNQHDLLLSTNFFVVQRVLADGSLQLIPYHGYKGERLGMDDSDRFLYGVSIPWRRSMINMADVCYDDTNHQQTSGLAHIVHYDRAVIDPDPMKYALTYYSVTPWDYDQLRKLQHQTFTTTKICEVYVDAETMKIVGKTTTPPSANNMPTN